MSRRLIIAVWAAGDDQKLDDAWVDQVVDLGSQYDYVTDVGFRRLTGK